MTATPIYLRDFHPGERSRLNLRWWLAYWSLPDALRLPKQKHEPERKR